MNNDIVVIRFHSYTRPPSPPKKEKKKAWDFIKRNHQSLVFPILTYIQKRFELLLLTCYFNSLYRPYRDSRRLHGRREIARWKNYLSMHTRQRWKCCKVDLQAKRSRGRKIGKSIVSKWKRKLTKLKENQKPHNWTKNMTDKGEERKEMRIEVSKKKP